MPGQLINHLTKTPWGGSLMLLPRGQLALGAKTTISSVGPNDHNRLWFEWEDALDVGVGSLPADLDRV